MAFLDNSGDIILDAVLTDTGRLRMAQGDGSFKISKFALGDDEINYSLYNKNHASGSAYYDLEVLQTPVLEAFTNNTSNLKTKLVSLSRTNILYMPVLKLNENNVNIGNANTIQAGSSKSFGRDGTATHFETVSDTKFYIAVDKKTGDALLEGRDGASSAGKKTPTTLTGLIEGYTGGPNNRDLIRVDQGLDTNEISPELGLDSDLLETAYIIEMDYRLGRVKSITNNNVAPVNFIDDDNIASYYLTSNYINPLGSPGSVLSNTNTKDKDALQSTNPQVFEGPRGSTLQFRIQASQELNSSTYLFAQIGQSQPANAANILGLEIDDYLTDGGTIYYIDSTVRVVGANTGYRLDIPVRYVKIDY
tara:strand:+ start:284 stop:1372 length:1089 start_codon:yes stop_codon:yes gene_type:complete